MILVATWNDGLFVFDGERRRHELGGRAVRALAPDKNGDALAIIDGHSLCRRTPDGTWSTVAISQFDLACLLAVGNLIYLGTDDARLLRVGKTGEIHPLAGFDAVPGREEWYAGSAVINGQVVGPPLGVRSLTATSNGAVLLANVHVGGIARSVDGGETWHPTMDINNDVHEVCAHRRDPDVVIAATAIGLCVSRDGGASWAVEQEGLQALYCSAVAFSERDIFVAASTDHFAALGGVYRRPIDGKHRLEPIGGRSEWLEGIVDTGCIATGGSTVALSDKGGNLHLSSDGGSSWFHRERGLPPVSCVLVV